MSQKIQIFFPVFSMYQKRDNSQFNNNINKNKKNDFRTNN